MAGFYDAEGKLQQLTPEVGWYKAAADSGMSLAQWVNQKYPTDTKAYGSTYHQLLASEGIFLKPNKEFGIRSTNLKTMLEGGVEMQAGALTKDSGFSSAALRTLFPSAILTAIEDRLNADLTMSPNAFDSMVAIDDTIQGDKWERPLINFSNITQRSQAIAQLAEPAAMMSITTSSVARTIPTLSIGLMISDQAKAATTLDLVSLAVARQFAIERNAQANEWFLAMLNGDTDLGQGSLSSASLVVTAVSLDSAASTGLTQKAWMKWLTRNGTKRRIDTVVTDLAGAMAIEGRANKPVITTDNPNSPRIDTLFSVANPIWSPEVKVYINLDSNWPAGTIMGFDSRFAIHRVTSVTAAYQAIEQFVMRRAEALRIDHGATATRLYDDAFDVLTFS